MKKITVTLMILSVILYALPALAGDCGSCKPVRPCRTTTGDGLFQSSSDAIAGCRPKPWLVRPMKPTWPVREEKFLTFQTLADNINGKIPPEAKSDVPAEPKSDVPAEAKSDVPSGGK